MKKLWPALLAFLLGGYITAQADGVQIEKYNLDCSQRTAGGLSETVSRLSDQRRTETVSTYDFDAFYHVEIIGAKLDSFSDAELSVLYRQAEYCQAMTDADIDKMREILSEDMIFTHMSGMQQSREEYLADIANGRLNYFTIGIEKPVIEVDGETAAITFTSVLNANAYGARGTFRMKGTHHYENRDGEWIAVNG